MPPDFPSQEQKYSRKRVAICQKVDIFKATYGFLLQGLIGQIGMH